MHTITETNRIPQTRDIKVRSAYVRKIPGTYTYHALHESQKTPKPRRLHSTHKIRQDETNDAQIEIEKNY